MSDSELLLKDGCGTLEKDGNKGAVLEGCENEGTELTGADSLVEQGYVEVKALFCEEDDVLK